MRILLLKYHFKLKALSLGRCERYGGHNSWSIGKSINLHQDHCNKRWKPLVWIQINTWNGQQMVSECSAHLWNERHRRSRKQTQIPIETALNLLYNIFHNSFISNVHPESPADKKKTKLLTFFSKCNKDRVNVRVSSNFSKTEHHFEQLCFCSGGLTWVWVDAMATGWKDRNSASHYRCKIIYFRMKLNISSSRWKLLTSKSV